MQCPRCDSEIERTASYCPECGLDIDALKERLREEGDDGGGGGGRDGPSTERASNAAGDPPSSSGATGPESDQSGSSQPDGPFQRASKQSTAEPEPQTGGSATKQADSGSARRAERSDRQATPNGGGQRRSRQTGGGAQSRRTAGVDASLPLVSGSVYGAVTYVLNFVVVLALFAYEIQQRGGDLTQEQMELHQMAGWVFYGGHRVKLSSPYASEGFNYLEQMYSGSVSTTVPKLAFYAIPAIGLLLAGRAVASKATGSGATDADRVKAGATVAIGYAALAVVGAATVFSVDVSTLSFGLQQVGGAIKPKMQSAVIYMGIVYPVVAGGVGGYLAD